MTVDQQPPGTGGAEPAGAGGGRWQRLRVPVIVAVVALAGLLYVAVNHRNESTSASGATPTPGAAGSATPSTTPSAAASSPACLPRIVETGFGVTEDVVHYGVIARSDCPQVAYNIVVSVQVFDRAGRSIAGHNDFLPEINVLLPGQQVGAAGSFYMSAARPVGRVEVRFTDAATGPVSAFAAWPTSVRITDLEYETVRGAPDRTTVTGQIVTEPARAVLCAPHTSLILRDAKGKIIYGAQGQVHADRFVTFDLAIPAEADRGKTTAYVALGEVGISLDPVSMAACRS